jgi:hypothetical protein
MFHFLRHSDKLPFLHDQLFTLQWNIPKCKWILIHYINSQRKPWYKRTERLYRFRRWFIRKAEGSFSNLANINEPRISIYIFRYLICFPRKVVIPLRIRRMDMHESTLSTIMPEMHTVTDEIFLKQNQLPDFSVSPVILSRNMHPSFADPQIRLSSPSLYNECSWPVSKWIEQGFLNPNNLHLLQHPENLPDHE